MGTCIQHQGAGSFIFECILHCLCSARRNEVRELEDLPPLDDGDVALVPANMTTMAKMQQMEPAADLAVNQGAQA